MEPTLIDLGQLYIILLKKTVQLVFVAQSVRKLQQTNC